MCHVDGDRVLFTMNEGVVLCKVWARKVIFKSFQKRKSVETNVETPIRPVTLPEQEADDFDFVDVHQGSYSQALFREEHLEVDEFCGGKRLAGSTVASLLLLLVIVFGLCSISSSGFAFPLPSLIFRLKTWSQRITSLKVERESDRLLSR